MPPQRLAHNEDTDHSLNQAQDAEAVRQLGCAYADYRRRITAWLDLNLESRRPDDPGDGQATRRAGGMGSW
jgi:hypothetical protein